VKCIKQKKKVRFVVVGFCAVFCVWVIGMMAFPAPLNISEQTPSPERLAVPLRISIPSIELANAPVERVGLVDGAMGVPTRAHSVGWYELGTHPGHEGSAVLAGHVNWFGGKDAVFARLTQVKEGDVIEILDSLGHRTYFRVFETKEFPADADTREVFFSDSGRSYLNLITCSGEWNQSTRTHESRFVVLSARVYP